VRGPAIIARTLSESLVVDRGGRKWQYHSRSDMHSKVACWAVLFDLLQTSSLMQAHVASGKVAFGINRRINDWQTGRKKDLDLVVARAGSPGDELTAFDLAELAARYQLVLTADDRAVLDQLPTAPQGASGATVLVALEAKACMTAHVRALPRLYDELTSSHATVHGDNDNALAVGFVMVNIADSFISPGRQGTGADAEAVVNVHRQPHDTERTLAKVREINRRPGPRSGQSGFDALGVMVVDMRNDGSPVTLVEAPPAPQPADDFFYDRMVIRAAHLYDASFGHV
jgi:hypothetical protein